MPEKNTIDVRSLQPLSLSVRPQIALGLPMARMQYLMQVAGDEQAPHFVPAQAPVNDGVAAQAIGGQWLYRPELRVAQRTVEPLGPEVRFLKDPAGHVRLQFELEEAPLAGLPAGAEPLAVKVESVALTWQEGGQARTRPLDSPTLVGTDDPQNPATPNFRLRVGVELTPEEVDPMYRALSQLGAGAAVTVNFSYGYWLDETVVVDDPPRRPPIIRDHRIVADGVGSLGVRGSLLRSAALIRPLQVRPEGPPTPPEPVNLTVPLINLTPVAPAPRLKLDRLIADVRFNPDLIKTVLNRQRQRQTQSNFRQVTLTRTVPFFFDPALEHNRPVFSAVVGDASLGAAWQNIGFGLVRAASFPNTVYRLPDEIRLAYNPDLAAPHVIPALYRDAEDEIRVRVLLRAAPWYDPASLVKLRDTLRKTSGGAISFATVVMGGYEKAVLRLGGAFPDQVRALGGAQDIEIGLEGSFEIVVDLSLEFYRLLAQLLVGPIGLTGQVDVTLNMAAPGDSTPQPQVFHVPLRLNLADVASLPLTVTLPEGDTADLLSPGQVVISSGAGVDTRVGGCAARLLQYDENSVTPLEVFAAQVDGVAFPLTLPATGGVTLNVKPTADLGSELWNAIQVELTGHELVTPAAQVLEHIHEVAPSGSISWRLQVECPLLTRTPLPDAYQTLYRVEVQIHSAGFADQQVILSPSAAQATVSMNQTLRDIVGSAGGDINRFGYRVRNIYFDHQGQWSEPKDGEGSNLFVFPNATTND
ncbi:hypothetical protein K7W42_03405 [Deinococcus sp. HMF7604]|uniref:hypothetical protein n=1 Tax=Deinococcus betulae TaxID=2873312 RepID=UPI001CCD4FC5|nr:hypothetical protein [Deinococcus betulae]MBZ9749906.1 hypothetical protein [Deinococcus betulae]